MRTSVLTLGRIASCGDWRDDAAVCYGARLGLPVALAASDRGLRRPMMGGRPREMAWMSQG